MLKQCYPFWAEQDLMGTGLGHEHTGHIWSTPNKCRIIPVLLLPVNSLKAESYANILGTEKRDLALTIATQWTAKMNWKIWCYSFLLQYYIVFSNNHKDFSQNSIQEFCAEVFLIVGIRFSWRRLHNSLKIRLRNGSIQNSIFHPKSFSKEKFQPVPLANELAIFLLCWMHRLCLWKKCKSPKKVQQMSQVHGWTWRLSLTVVHVIDQGKLGKCEITCLTLMRWHITCIEPGRPGALQGLGYLSLALERCCQHPVLPFHSLCPPKKTH